MALQELDLDIQYRAGKTNARADALSRYPVPLSPDDCSQTETPTLIAAVEPVDSSLSTAQSREQDPDPDRASLAQQQRSDSQLLEIVQYITEGVLPTNEGSARKILLSQSSYTVLDGVLYHVEEDKTLRVIPPTNNRHQLFLEAHEGAFSGHLRQAKIHSQLSRHFWWPGMRKDINEWCRNCTKCASRSVGQAVRPKLSPIPVGGPFDMVGVNVLQLPKTKQGNRYAVVFMDYLTKWPEVFADQIRLHLLLPSSWWKALWPDMESQLSCCPTEDPHSCRSSCWRCVNIWVSPRLTPVPTTHSLMG